MFQALKFTLGLRALWECCTRNLPCTQPVLSLLNNLLFKIIEIIFTNSVLNLKDNFLKNASAARELRTFYPQDFLV
jgi:hypothetical protein